MDEAKTMTYYMINGTPSGIIKCTLGGWSGLIYKIPRLRLNDEKNKSIDALNQPGVYLLIGENSDSKIPIIYVGQASKRNNGTGPIARFIEHEDKIWWKTIIFFTTTDDSFNFSEISYLENAFYNKIKNIGNYNLDNRQEPSLGNISEEKESELNQYINNAKIILSALNYNVLEPIVNIPATKSQKNANSPLEDILIYQTKTFKAVGQITNNGFVVFSGSSIRDTVTKSCPEKALNMQAKYSSFIKNGTLTKDLLFSSPSNALAFLLGNPRNGKALWKNEDGKSINDIEKLLEQDT